MPMVSASCRRQCTAVIYYLAAHLQLIGVSLLQKEMHSNWLLPVARLRSSALLPSCMYGHTGVHPQSSTLQA